jgi:VWFA-related protein
MTMNNFRVSMLPCVASVMLLAGHVHAQTPPTGLNASSKSGQVRVPDRPSTALFKGQPGVQKTDIFFDPTTRVVTAKLLVQDPQGYFIPNIRRDNFAVYEDGVRQKDPTVEVEHIPVSVGVLAEYGGRYQSLNDAMAGAVGTVASQFLDEAGQHDTVALWRYGDALEELAGFTEDREALRKAVTGLRRPPFSELNFYDALIAALKRMPSGSGRQALIVISSGIDTFSKAQFNDVLAAVRANAIPVYVIDIGKAVRQQRATGTGAGNYPENRWQRAQGELARVARASGGRLYVPESTYETASIFDDILENLRVRYVIRYTSTSVSDAARSRMVRIDLVNPSTDRPLEIIDEEGKRVPWKMTVTGNYLPSGTPVAGEGNQPPAGEG